TSPRGSRGVRRGRPMRREAPWAAHPRSTHLTGPAGPPEHQGMPTSENPTLDTTRSLSALSEEYVECVMRHDPVYATEMGIHDYDDKLPDPSREGLGARMAWLHDLDQRLGS